MFTLSRRYSSRPRPRLFNIGKGFIPAVLGAGAITAAIIAAGIDQSEIDKAPLTAEVQKPARTLLAMRLTPNQPQPR